MNRLGVLAPVALGTAALLAVLVGLTLGGGASALALQDPGAVVRYGLPLAKLALNIALAVMLGGLVIALFALSPGEGSYGRSVDLAAAGAFIATVAAAVSLVFTYLSVSGSPFSLSEQFGAGLQQFVTEIGLGRSWLTTSVLAAIVTVLAFAVRNQVALIFVTALAALTLLPLAQEGHAAGTAGHRDAVSALGIHMLFAGVWLGGLLTIALLRRGLNGERLATVVRRYSTIALVCFIAVLVSGYVSAALRVGNWAALASPYGLLVIGKAFALAGLGVAGWIHRRRLIARINAAGRGFAALVASELAVMGIASGLAAALARTPTPVAALPPAAGVSAAELLTGQPLPPPPSLAGYLGLWHPDIIWVLVCGFGTFFYLAGFVRLRKRGDHWPIYRPVMWTAGMAILFYLTSGGVGVYEQYLFSAHMIGHMGLTMLVPLLLVPCAPVTLALRAIEGRADGSRGAREWIYLAVHSRFAALVSNPVVAAIIFASSLWIFYFTPLLKLAMVDHLWHEFMLVHFLISGYLFVQSLIGADPVPYRFAYPVRLVELLATMTVHAFFGVSLTTSQSLLAAEWFGSLGWGFDALTEQQTGGGIAWGVGEFPLLILALTITVQWTRSDERESKRRDRHADRTGDAELAAYNARLARLNARDTRAEC